jgi:energy-coupling factor transport system ATP-binding protein
MQHALQLSRLSFTYRSWKEEVCDSLFSDLSLDLQEGSKTLLLAPFNKGKTTLAKIICKVCPKYFPGSLEGSITMFGMDLSTLEPWDLLGLCSFVSQNPQEQFIAASVEEELAFPLESMGIEREEMVRRITGALNLWGLQDLRTSSLQELSGGERKRVLLAVQAVLQARLWILDEAFDDLDQQWRYRLRETIQTSDKTILVLASRYLEEFSGLFDQVVLLDQKTIHTPAFDELLPRFSQLCGDDQPNPLEAQVLEIAEKHKLCCTKSPGRTETSKYVARPILFPERPGFSPGERRAGHVGRPNGSGKSSFSRLLCGLDEPKGGAVTIDGQPFSAKELSRKAGYLFQNPDLQIFLPTVEEELSWSLKRRKDLEYEQVKSRVAECADLFGLTLSDTPSTMSYPLRKALQAAVYFLLDRPFYILDELDSSLTYHSALSIIARLRQRGAGLLIITHDRHFAGRIVQRGYSIVDGRMESL